MKVYDDFRKNIMASWHVREVSAETLYLVNYKILNGVEVKLKI